MVFASALGLGHDHLRQTVAARPGRHKECGELAGKGLCLVVARRAHNLAGAGDHLVEFRDNEMSFRIICTPRQ